MKSFEAAFLFRLITGLPNEHFHVHTTEVDSTENREKGKVVHHIKTNFPLCGGSLEPYTTIARTSQKRLGMHDFAEQFEVIQLISHRHQIEVVALVYNARKIVQGEVGEVFPETMRYTLFESDGTPFEIPTITELGIALYLSLRAGISREEVQIAQYAKDAQTCIITVLLAKPITIPMPLGKGKYKGISADTFYFSGPEGETIIDMIGLDDGESYRIYHENKRSFALSA